MKYKKILSAIFLIFLFFLEAYCFYLLGKWIFKTLSEKPEIQVQAWQSIVGVISTIVLGGIALFQEHFKKRWFDPDLLIDFQFNPPGCHRTEFRNLVDGTKKANAYYFRFSITNVGKTHAKQCEVVIEKFYDWEDDRKIFVSDESWSPVNLKWSGNVSSNEFRIINPNRKVFCDIGHIAADPVLEFYEEMVSRNDLLFELEVLSPPFSQDHQFRKGKYKIDVAIFCENSRRGNIPKKSFIIDWSGNWFRTENEMFQKGVTIQAV